MKKILLGIAILFFITQVSYSQESSLDRATVEVCNQVMENIFKDILKIKLRYKELDNFNRSALQIKHPYALGIYRIEYSQDIESFTKTKLDVSGVSPFQFSLAIVDINESWQAMNHFEDLRFDNLRLKFYGFFVQPQPERKPKHLKSDLTKEISVIVHNNVQPLYELGYKTKKDISKEEAIDIAKKAMRDKNINIDRYYLREIKEFEWKGRDIWRLTFDLKEKLKQRIRMMGGEIFVNVDKKTGETAIRYGE